MPISVDIGTSTYNIPITGERSWGSDTTDLLQALATEADKVASALYTLSKDFELQNTSGDFGLLANFAKGYATTQVSTEGWLRLANPSEDDGVTKNTKIGWRNSGNTANLLLFPSSDTILEFAGQALVGVSEAQTLTNKTLTAPVIDGSVSGTAILDEDDLVSDSDTQLATQQSIKAYVDTHAAASTGVHGVTGSVVGTENSQVLTNKTLSDSTSLDFADVTVSTNSFAKPAKTIARITSGDTTLNTITGGSDGAILVVQNKTGDELTITDDSAADGILTGTSADFVLRDDATALLIYNSSDSRWALLGGGGAGTGGIRVDLYDPISTTLPTGAVTIDGQSVVNEQFVLFSNLTVGGNRIYQAIEAAGSVSGWIEQALYDGVVADPTQGESVRINKGDAFSGQLAVFDGSDFLINDVVRYFDGPQGTDYWEQSSIKTSTLTDNTTSGVVFSVGVTASENWVVDYSLTRGSGEKETGQIYITSDGTSVALSVANAALTSTGVTFDADIDTGNIRLLYTTTSTGDDATMKYFTKRWSNSAGGPSGVPSYSALSSSTSAAGSASEVQYRGAGGNLAADADFQWDDTAEAINLNGFYQHKLIGPVVLLDNQALAQTIFSLSATDYRYMVIDYSLLRDGNYQTGRLLMANDGSTASISDDNISTGGIIGITFTADISTSNVRLRYTSTSTGFDASFKYTIRRWA